MASTISGSIYFTGLDNTGNDWAKTLEQLKQIESINLNRLEAWKSDWNLRYQAFTKVIEAATAARTTLGSLQSRNNFIDKAVTSSNETIVTATATAAAQDGQHTINVLQTASNSIWANTGHKFSSKNEIINDTGATQQFSFSYAGKNYSIDVAANTTLDSFVSLVNNHRDNPGIKVSLIQTSGGYYFQVAGKDSGVENNLVVNASSLKGFDTAGKSSLWQSNAAVAGDKALTSPSTIAYDLVLKDGRTKTITLSGDSTLDDLVKAVNSQLGTGTASLDPATGDLKLTNIQAMTRRDSSVKNTYEPDSVHVKAGSQDDIKTGYMIAENNTTNLSFDIVMADGTTRSISVTGGTKREDFLAKLAKATGNTLNMVLDAGGAYYMDLKNVTSVTETTGAALPSDFAFDQKPSTPASPDDKLFSQLSTKGSNYVTTMEFRADKLSEKISNSDPSMMKEYMVVMEDGSTKTISISGDATYQNLADKLVADLGTAADFDSSTGRLTLTGVKSVALIAGLDPGTGYTTSLTCDNTVSFNAIAPSGSDPAQAAATALETPPDLVFKHRANGASSDTEITVASGSTIDQVFNELRRNGVNVQLLNEDGSVAYDGSADIVPGAFDNSKNYTLQVTDGVLQSKVIGGQVVSSDNWSIQKSANAMYKVNNWPMVLESASNQVTDVIEGVTFNIYNTGEAKLSVATDVQSIQDSIQEFLDAVNSVIKTVQTFSKFDENAQTTTNDPDKKDNDNYSMSQLTSEKGGLLQGNYGVQLFDSNFMSVLTGRPAGYTARTTANDLLSGDLVSSLASMGIKVCTDENNDSYGLLMIGAPGVIDEMRTMDQETYVSLLTNNLDDVLDFFCGPSVAGTTDTNQFRFSSHIGGITKPGTYDVTYDVGADGTISNVMIGGVKAENDTTMGSNYFTATSGDARGVAIIIDDLTGGSHSGTLRIKQGLVSTVDDFLKSSLTYQNVGSGTTQESIELKANNGGLMILQANYKAIMDSVDRKIEREQKYLANWEKHQKSKFARLQALLSNYSQTQSQLESQLKQLSGNK